MKEYILLFRADYIDIATVSVLETKERNDRWMDWINRLEANDRLAEGGNHLNSGGKVMRSKGEITDGPYREEKKSILGYILIFASSLDEAVELAKDCPLLAGENTSVEVREISGI